MKIAQYKNLEYDFLAVCGEDMPDHYVRVSEFVEVEFTPLDKRETVKAEVAFIDNQIGQVNAAAQVKLNELNQRKSELLALEDLS